MKRLKPLFACLIFLYFLMALPLAAADSEPKAAAGIGLAAAAERLKARLSWDPLTGSGSFERGGDRISFALDVPVALWNYAESLTIPSPANGETGPLLQDQTLSSFASRFGASESARATHFSVAAILIDPGHGGKDTGAIGEHKVGGKTLRVVEKDLALEVGRKVRDALKARFPDKRVLLSREGDTYPTLEKRVEMANDVDLGEREAIIYVSIHANASFNKSARGFEVWYLNPEYRRTVLDADHNDAIDKTIAPILNAMLEEEFTTESIILARDIMASLKSNIGGKSPDRGLRAEEWFVVRNARMPSVLVEMGFVTNPDEARLLAGGDYLKKIADSIYTGISGFVTDFENLKGPRDQ